MHVYPLLKTLLKKFFGSVLFYDLHNCNKHWSVGEWNKAEIKWDKKYIENTAYQLLSTFHL